MPKFNISQIINWTIDLSYFKEKWKKYTDSAFHAQELVDNQAMNGKQNITQALNPIKKYTNMFLNHATDVKVMVKLLIKLLLNNTIVNNRFNDKFFYKKSFNRKKNKHSSNSPLSNNKFGNNMLLPIIKTSLNPYSIKKLNNNHHINLLQNLVRLNKKFNFIFKIKKMMNRPKFFVVYVMGKDTIKTISLKNVKVVEDQDTKLSKTQ